MIHLLINFAILLIPTIVVIYIIFDTPKFMDKLDKYDDNK
jgi:hypothetical protein